MLNGGGSFPPADRTLTYPTEYYVSRNTVKSANVWDIAMLLNFLNVQFWQIYIDTVKFATAQKIVCLYGYRSGFG